MKIMKKLLISTLLFITPIFGMEKPEKEGIFLSPEDIQATAHSGVLKPLFEPELQKKLFSHDDKHEFILPETITQEDFKLTLAHLKRIESLKQGAISNPAFQAHFEHASIRDLCQTVALADFWEIPELGQREPELLRKLAERCANKKFFDEYLSEKQSLSLPMQSYLVKKLSNKNINVLAYWLMKGYQELHRNKPSDIIQCKKHSNPIQSLAVSANGTLIASGSSSHTGIHLWNTQSGKHLKTFEDCDWSKSTSYKEPRYSRGEQISGGYETRHYPEKITRLCFSDDNKLFATSEAQAEWLDAENAWKKHTLWPLSENVPNDVYHVPSHVNRYCSDNHIVADIYSPDQKISRTTQWLPIKERSLADRFKKLLLIPKDSRRQLIIKNVAQNDAVVASYDLNAPCQLALFDANAQKIAYVCTDNTVRIWRPLDNSIQEIGKIASPIQHQYDIPGFAWNRDANNLLAVYDDTSVVNHEMIARVWNIRNGTHKDFVNTKAAFFSHDGVLLITICADQKDAGVQVWEVSTGRLLRSLKFAKEISNAICMPNNAAIACADVGGTINIVPLYDPAVGQEWINGLQLDDMLLLLFGHRFNKERDQRPSNNEMLFKKMLTLPDGIRQAYMKTIWPNVRTELKPKALS